MFPKGDHYWPFMSEWQAHTSTNISVVLSDERKLYKKTFRFSPWKSSKFFQWESIFIRRMFFCVEYKTTELQYMSWTNKVIFVRYVLPFLIICGTQHASFSKWTASWQWHNICYCYINRLLSVLGLNLLKTAQSLWFNQFNQDDLCSLSLSTLKLYEHSPGF